jgi:PAS domain S-box-containing protein
MTKLEADVIRAAAFGLIFGYLWLLAGKEGIRRSTGWSYIFAAFLLIFVAMLIDITEHFPSFSKFVVIGDTPYEAILKNVIGFILGVVLLVFGMAKLIPNVAELIRTREALRKSEQRLELALRGADLGFWDWDLQTGKAIWSNRAVEMLGYSHEELEHDLRTWKRAIYPDDWPHVSEVLNNHLEGRVPFLKFESRMRSKSGEWTWISIRGTVVEHDEDDKPLRMAGIILDFTERKRAEEENVRLVTAIEQAAESIVITDLDGTIDYVNPVFEHATGYTREDVLGQNPRILKSGKQDAAFYQEMWQAISSGKVWSGHFINKKKDGSLFEEEATISPVIDQSGKIVNYVAVKRDVTVEVMLEKQLLQAQKMEAVGTLAGGVAHDFNNLLQVVLGYADMLLMDKNDQDPDRERLLAIRQAARHGGDLVKELLTFSRKVPISLRPTDLNQEVKRVRELLYRTIPKMIEIELLLADDLKTVGVDSGQMEQVLLNLAINARDAMPDGGKLTIETENVTLTKEYCETHIEVLPGEYLLLTVSDTGHGMENEVLEHIFEPFYSTKEAGKGTGLGLATVFGIVKGHNGNVTCYSEPGTGTSFRIYLPVMKAEIESNDATTTEVAVFGTETILLVDDEDQIRNLGKEMLGTIGYKVLTASNGQEAVELYRKKKLDISLVILDLIMPEMGGRECLDELLGLDPKAKVLMASGYSANGPTKEALEAGAKGFIRKPYEAKDLFRIVREVLDED